MSTAYSVGQMNQLGDGLEAAGFTPDDVTKLRAPELLAQLKLVLMGLAVIVRQGFKLACAKTFNPTEFLGEGWSVWKGPADGDGLEGEEDCDKRADELEVVDWEQVFFETHLKEGETSIQGEEKLKRAKASGNIQLGAKHFLSLWDDYQQNGKNSILEKLRAKGITRIYFFGTVLRLPSGGRCVLCLYFGGGRWSWGCSWLGGRWVSNDPSVSLASVK